MCSFQYIYVFNIQISKSHNFFVIKHPTSWSWLPLILQTTVVYVCMYIAHTVVAYRLKIISTLRHGVSISIWIKLYGIVALWLLLFNKNKNIYWRAENFVKHWLKLTYLYVCLFTIKIFSLHLTLYLYMFVYMHIGICIYMYIYQSFWYPKINSPTN